MAEALISNRISAIVAPRHPKTLSPVVRIVFRLPLTLLLAHYTFIFAITIISSRQGIKSQDSLGKVFADGGLPPLTTSSRHSPPFLDFFIIQCISFLVQILTAAIEVGPLNSTGNDNRPRTWNYDPSSPNLLEWAASYHFSSSSSDILQWIAFLHACQLLCINFMALTGHLTKYRLIPTAIFGISGILHFMYTIQSQNGGRHYPIFLYLVRLPELFLLSIVILVDLLHLITFVIADGAIRTPPHIILWRAKPSLSDDFSSVLLKLGTACMEATQAMGLMNEMDPIALQLMDEDIHPLSGFQMNDQARGDSISEQQQQQGEEEEEGISTTIFNGTRRSNIIKQWSHLINLTGRLLRIGMSGLFHTFYRILDNTNPQQKNIIKSAGEEEEDEEKEDQDYRPEESEEESEDDTNEDPQLYEEIFHLQTETSQIDNNDNITTFISLANTGRMITRQMRRELEAESLGITSSLIQQLFGRSRNCSSRYTDNQGVSEDIRLRQLAAIISVSKREKLVNSQTRSRSSPITTATAMTEVLLAANIGNAITSNNIERQSCVVCRVESRQVVLRPCGCLCLCDACREELAVRRFQDCPCCRRKVEGIRRRGDENRGGAQPKLFPII